MILVWFRRDLRTLDHTALKAALDTGLPVVACFVSTPEQWREHHMAPMQADLIARRLSHLNEELAKLNIPFLYKEVPEFADVTEVINDWATSLSAQRVMANIHYEVNEQALDREVSHALSIRGIAFDTFHDKCVHAPTTVLNKQGSTLKYSPRLNVLGWQSFKCQLYRNLSRKPSCHRLPSSRFSQIATMMVSHSLILENLASDGSQQPVILFSICENLLETVVMPTKLKGISLLLMVRVNCLRIWLSALCHQGSASLGCMLKALWLTYQMVKRRG